MKTTTYKCDRCGAESVGGDTIKLLSIYLGEGQYMSDAVRRGGQKEWCLKCRIETGIHKPEMALPEIKPVDPVPTLEEMIREVVREEIQNQ